jgi:hypothetical protein
LIAPYKNNDNDNNNNNKGEDNLFWFLNDSSLALSCLFRGLWRADKHSGGDGGGSG